jgi:hypothetical protein
MIAMSIDTNRLKLIDGNLLVIENAIKTPVFASEKGCQLGKKAVDITVQKPIFNKVVEYFSQQQ